MSRGGPDEARKRLADFWRAASLGGDLPAVQRAVTDRLFSLLPAAGSPTFNWLSAWSQYLSPYDLNPLNINPLKDLIERFVDFDALRADRGRFSLPPPMCRPAGCIFFRTTRFPPKR